MQQRTTSIIHLLLVILIFVPFSVVMGEVESDPQKLIVDFYPGKKMRPQDLVYSFSVTVSDQATIVSTTDRTGHIPGASGDIGTGTLTLRLSGRSDDTSAWSGRTWAGGTACAVKGSESGLGIGDTEGGNRIDGGEAILVGFDLHHLTLNEGKSLVLTGVKFGSVAGPKAAQLWHRTGKSGQPGAGQLIAGDGDWNGQLVLTDGAEIAVAGNTRLRSITLEVADPTQIVQRRPDAGSATEPMVPAGRETPSKHNIIMILADDMAWYDTPVRMDDRLTNSAQEIMRSLRDPSDPTQFYKWNLQRLADAGMRFRNAYSGAPQCTPTRACLQTGMTTARHRLSVELGGKGIGKFNMKPELSKFPVRPSGVRKPFPDDMITIPEALAPFQVQCAHYGKWHLESDPAVEGYVESDGDTDNDGGKTYDPKSPTIPLELDNPKRIKEITDKTIAFMTKQKAAGKPFYVQLSHYAAHAPWECKRSSRALFQSHPDIVAYNQGGTDPEKINRKKDPAVFFGMLYELDQSIGRLLNELDRLNLADTTYVIFKSDNGYRRFDTRNFVQPFFGRKWFLWQAGIRVAMIARGPGIPAGTVCDANVVTYDLLPTFYEWAGGDASELTNIDGFSLKNIMSGQQPESTFANRPLFFHYPHYRSSTPLSAVVKGNHKLVYAWDATIRHDLSMSDPRMLFDLRNDPGEFHNVTSTNPEVAEQLWRELDQYLHQVDARRPMDNSSAYNADQGAQFDADENADRRVFFAPFTGSRVIRKELNDSPAVNLNRE